MSKVSVRIPAAVSKVAFVAMVLASAGPASSAQEFPSRPVRFISPMAPGGGGDLNARRLAEQLRSKWGQPVIVENRTGSGGNNAAAAASGATPDGYTLFFASHPIFAVNPVLYEALPFNADRDFKPVVLVSKTPHILIANAALPAKTLSDLVALAKSQPGKLNFGSGGVGTSIHLAGELFKNQAGIDMKHVPYRGAAPAMAALAGNEIQLLFDSTMTAIGHVRGGRARGLAIASAKRSAALPELPTFDESGLPGFEAGVSHGLLVPAKTPASVIKELNQAVNEILANPDYRKQMAERGVELVGGTPGEFQVYLAAERKKWARIIKEQGIRKN
ncbi:MAG: tripartite tricarboxylate transporter substrate binding protein [Betaproteobacteria bacterium]|nr:tripartite tricarboxylate transporter substrate binding protein [Betaproteobacteria bacterium]